MKILKFLHKVIVALVQLTTASSNFHNRLLMQTFNLMKENSFTTAQKMNDSLLNPVVFYLIIV